MSSKEIMLKEEIFPVEKKVKVELSKAVSFIGSPSKHPHEDDKFILIMDPLSDHTAFIEFIKDDVVFVEELPSLLTDNDESVSIKRIWIKEGSLALKMEPFVVAKTKSSVFFAV